MKRSRVRIALMVACLTALILPGSSSLRFFNKQQHDPPEVIQEDPLDKSIPPSRGFFGSSDEADEDDAEGKERGLIVVKKDRKRFALVIGNADYKNIPALPNPRNDANDMRRSLKKLGFQVTYLPDAPDRRSMVEAVSAFCDNLAHYQDAVGLFFYAGHAMQINGINYLIPVEAIIRSEADVQFETLEINQLLQNMDQAKNSMNIIILDACRNNPYARGFRSTADRGLAPMDSPTGSIIVFATAPGKTAEDGRGRNGTYTKHLLQHIGEPELTIEQLLKQVRIGVIEETGGAQTPWETSSLRGDFCFAGCPDGKAAKEQALKEAEEKLKEKTAAERKRLEKEWATLEAERMLIDAKKQQMDQKAAQAKQQKNQEELKNIRKEQQSLSEQRQILKKEHAQIERQKAVIANKKTDHDQKEDEIARLKLEQEKLEKARLELERMRLEAEQARWQAEQERMKVERMRWQADENAQQPKPSRQDSATVLQGQGEDEKPEPENREAQPVAPPIVGF